MNDSDDESRTPNQFLFESPMLSQNEPIVSRAVAAPLPIAGAGIPLEVSGFVQPVTNLCRLRI